MKLIYKRLILINLLFNNFIKKPVHIKHILSHRGYSTIKDDENTIKSVKEAIHKKFKGVEIDIFMINQCVIFLFLMISMMIQVICYL